MWVVAGREGVVAGGEGVVVAGVEGVGGCRRLGSGWLQEVRV